MINWVDLFSREHKVDFASNPSSGSVTVCFPIAAGGSWNWQDANARNGKSADAASRALRVVGAGSSAPYWERTGFNGSVAWVQAEFLAEGEHAVRIKATGWLLKGTKPDAGLMGEMKARFGDVADLAESVERITKEVS
jgi:hypothetical protein